MRLNRFIILLVLCLVFGAMRAPGQETSGNVADASGDKPQARIGVFMRMNFNDCLDTWLPTAEYLSKKIPGYDFTIVPMASKNDMFMALENGEVDFIAANPALYLATYERFGTSPVVAMTLPGSDKTAGENRTTNYSGAIISRADRKDLKSIEDLRGKEFTAVKNWSFSGWLMQWGVLKQHGISPDRDLKAVGFLGTHAKVVQDVLDGSADAGAVGTDTLELMIARGEVSPIDLNVFNTEGVAVPLASMPHPISTEMYPGWVIAKAQNTPDALSALVSEALIERTPVDNATTIFGNAGWTIPQNEYKVRALVENLMGRNFSYQDGFQTNLIEPALWSAIVAASVSGVVFFIIFGYIALRAQRRASRISLQLDTTRRELLEHRAEHHMTESILARADCGIDIVDMDNNIIYADAGIERHFGNWRGKKCFEYYKEPLPSDESTEQFDRFSEEAFKDRRLISVPFKAESGERLQARIHVPYGFSMLPEASAVFPTEEETLTPQESAT